MKFDLLKRLLCIALSVLCVASMLISCAKDPTDDHIKDPSDGGSEGNGDGGNSGENSGGSSGDNSGESSGGDSGEQTGGDSQDKNEPQYEYVAFTDVDFSDLSNFKEAKGANSGNNGVIYVVNQRLFWDKSGDMVQNYDETKFVVSLQGLLNRENPTLYVDDGDSMNWFRFLRSFTDAPLYGMKKATITNFSTFLSIFSTQIKELGIVVWDPCVPATSNLATTVCGVDGYLPVMYSEESDSLYRQLISKFGADIVKMDLCGKFTGESGTTVWQTDRTSTGSAKCDAYVWALENYLKLGKCDPAHIAYMTDFYPLSSNGSGAYLDNSVYETYLPSQDYVVANGIFTFDLSIFGDHPATDDPTQRAGLDYEILKEILLCQYEINEGEFSQCIGFPPFPYKYTDKWGGLYDDVMAEWTAVEVMTAYNIACVADCPGPSSLYNCSIYEKYEQQIEYSQAEKREEALNTLPEYDENTYYVYIYGGDYDAAAWTYHISANDYWQDPNRGRTPIAWAFNPNIMERVPMLWDVFYHTATENDYFIAGDSGAGYINPLLLKEGQRKHSDLPDGLDAWARWCEKWYAATDITVTGHILDGLTGYSHNDSDVLNCYIEFSPDGIGVWNWPGVDSGVSVLNGTAISGIAQDSGFTKYTSVEEAAQAIVKTISSGRKVNFYPIKTNIADPTQIYQVLQRVQQLLNAEGRGRKIEVVDPYTFFAMLERELTE